MSKPHELHRHRLLEHKFALCPDKCIVDAEFSYMFREGTERIESDSDHIIVSRNEYYNVESLLGRLDTARGCSHEYFRRYLIGLLTTGQVITNRKSKIMSDLLIKETLIQRIIRKTGRKPIECKCALCKMQCHTPCLGTPQDIERIIDAGYADRLKLTYWAAGMVMGVVDRPIPMIQAVAGDESCAFFQNGLCELHSLGLKPTEGKLSHHSIQADNFKASKSLSWNVPKEWISNENVEVIANIIRKLDTNRTTIEQKP